MSRVPVRSGIRHPLLLLVLALHPVAALAGQLPAPQLGRIDFPATARAEAHREFVTGVLWLHSFEYPRAAAAFQRAQGLDSAFVLAYWGEAMTHTHPVWNRQDLPAARAILARLGPTAEARLARAATPRERGYLQAVERLYGEGSKPRRDTLYAEAMEALVRAHPDDLEAKAFYALALIGLSQGVRDTATYGRAAHWADTVFQANAEHPGAAHYLIHAWDDPLHARLGLPAARAYARIAPDAAHAQHMTTHIFLALGMWDEVVSQNTLAMDLTSRLPGHYTIWLHYALLQQGRIREATSFLDELRENMVTQRMPRQAALAFMRAAHAVSGESWDDGPALWTIDVDGLPAAARAPEIYFQGEVAFRTQQPAVLTARARDLRALSSAAAEESPLGGADPSVGGLTVMALQLEGLHQLLAGDRAAALRTLTRAAAVEDSLPLEFGPPAIVQPSHELLGIVLGERDPARAMRAFQRALALAPGRARSLLGLASAATATGDIATARQALATLDTNARRADPAWKATLGLIRARVPATEP